MVSIVKVFIVSSRTMPSSPWIVGSVHFATLTLSPIHSWAVIFCGVIMIYEASGVGFVGRLSIVNRRAIVLRSSRIRAGFSTVPPDFTDVRMLVSSARSSVTFFRRSSGSIWLSSRFLRIASFLFLLVLYNDWSIPNGSLYLDHNLRRGQRFNFLGWCCRLGRGLCRRG